MERTENYRTFYINFFQMWTEFGMGKLPQYCVKYGRKCVLFDPYFPVQGQDLQMSQ